MFKNLFFTLNMMEIHYILFSLFFIIFEVKATLDAQIRWGTYKPHLIFAMTEKTLNPLTLGFFYFNRLYNIDYQDEFLNTVRYKYKPDILTRFLEHNAIDYALEQIEDSLNRMFCEVRLMKENYESIEKQSWKVSVEPVFKYSDYPEEEELQSNNNKMAFVFYANIKNFFQKDAVTLLRLQEYNKDQFSVVEVIQKNKKDQTEKVMGYFRIESFEDKCHLTNSIIDFFKIGEEKIWDVDLLYYQNVVQSEKFKIFKKTPDRDQDSQEFSQFHTESNIFYMTFFLQQNCKYIISYDSGQIPLIFDEKLFEESEAVKRNRFYEVFYEKFLNQSVSYQDEDGIKKLRLSMYAFSNLIGGISYYSGKFLELNNVYHHSFKEVFTCTPSRNKFPRGFLWDEGFHLLIVCKFNEGLCIQMIDNWLNLMDIDGWIAREQIRNEETAYGLDERFIHQDSYEGNPPTMLFPILYLMNRHKTIEKEENSQNLKNFLHKCFNKLKLWFFWFLENQNDYEKLDFFDETFLFSEKLNFRWHCKGDCEDGNFLGSGLDDFPRQPPGTLSKSHLDIHIWILFFSETLAKLAKLLNLTTDYKEYDSIYQDLHEKLYEEFLDKSDNFFKDAIIETIRDEDKTEKIYNNNLGYINLFPLMFGYIKDTDILQKYFKLLLDPNQLWSEFGVRSLSISNPFFGTGDNYWRGPIWIPINFLILRGLKVYYDENPYASFVYKRLRENLIRNMQKQFELSGQIWENYNSLNGYGQREGGFCGWSALVTLILKEEYF